jgi:uncharacterized protein (TIGR01244 family)
VAQRFTCSGGIRYEGIADIMKRRTFIACGSLSVAAYAIHAPAQARTQFVCPPCGCANDGKVFDAAGQCVCGLTLVDKAALDQIAGVPNFLKLDQQVWTAGQPSMEHFSKLKEEGVKVVINLRPHTESNNLGVIEEARVKELGLTYVNIPVAFNDLRDASVAEFLKATDEQLPKGPVLIHCAAAVRVGGFWMIRRVLRDGWTFEKALEEANRIGLSNQSQLVEFARQYIDKNSKK